MTLCFSFGVSSERRGSPLKRFLLPLALSVAAQSHAAREQIPPRHMQPSSMDRVCERVDCVDSLSKFGKIKEVQPSTTPFPLKKKTDLGLTEKLFASRVDAIFDRNPAVAMIFIDKGEIVYERYHREVTDKTPLLGYSMSKSLTSMVVGRALCAGDLKSLETRMGDVNSDLNGTAYGNASIRQILMMASGAIRGTLAHGGSPSMAGFGNPHNFSVYSSTLSQLRAFKDHQKRADGSQVRAGEEFSYKNLDTQSLAFLFPTSGDRTFTAIFEKEVWRAAGAENKGYWIHDAYDYIHTMSSFHGTARDWARVSLLILDAVSSDKSDCFTNYLKAATQTQIRNLVNSLPEENRIGRAFGGYGYQFWTQNFDDSEAIYLSGHRGQRIAISPKKQRVMVVFSFQENYMSDLYKLFASW